MDRSGLYGFQMVGKFDEQERKKRNGRNADDDRFSKVVASLNKRAWKREV